MDAGQLYNQALAAQNSTSELRVDAASSNPAESHFFVAVCALRPQTGAPTFVYVPRAANVPCHVGGRCTDDTRG